MTTPSAFSNTGLSLSLKSPLVGSRSYPTVYLSDKASAYTHTISAFGGFDSAEIIIQGNQINVEELFDNGLVRHVQVHNHGLALAWEGFVNEIELVLGGLTITRGPVMNIANRVSVVYADDGTPGAGVPAIGARTVTAISDDTASQAIYGIIEKVLSTGPRDATEAVRERDTYLTEHAYPPTSQQVTLGRTGNQAQVTLRCLGYFHWFDTYVYNWTPDPWATINLSTKLQRIVTADTNAIFSTDYSGITTNAFAVSEYEDDDMMAMALIKSLVALGGTSYERYLFNVYDDRKVWYYQAPSIHEYKWKLSDRTQNVYNVSGAVVNPWDVRPGKWLFVPDFLIGRTQPSNPRLDPRMIFLESVTYDAPYGLSITGGKTDRLPQLLAELSLGGIDA